MKSLMLFRLRLTLYGFSDICKEYEKVPSIAEGLSLSENLKKQLKL
jgi:hypothetical protein